MVPYIALLIVLIVAVLFAVYHRIDTFEIQGLVLTESTKIQPLLDFGNQLVKINKGLKEKLDSGNEFHDTTLTESQLLELGVGFSRNVDGSLNIPNPVSKALSGQIETTLNMLNDVVEKGNKGVADGTFTPNMTLREVARKLNPDSLSRLSEVLSFYNGILQNLTKTSNAQEKYIAKKLVVTSATSSDSPQELTCPSGRPPISQNGKVYCRDLLGKLSATPLTCPAGTTPFLVFEETGKYLCLSSTHPYVTNPGSALTPGQLGCKETEVLVMNIINNSQKCVPKQVQSQNVLGVSTDDLFKAVGGVQQALKASKPAEIEKVQALAPEQTDLSTKEMEDRIARNVARQLKDSLILERAAATSVGEMPCPYASVQSDATAQGTEYAQARPNPGPDMSEYIRKDSIPCWNCSLP